MPIEATRKRSVQAVADELTVFMDDYYDRFIGVLSALNRTPLSDMLRVLDGLMQRGSTLWLLGNGGSAGISNHAACDLTKGPRGAGTQGLRCLSLSSNVPMLSALANDLGYERIFAEQLAYYAQPGDAVLLVSSSGNSPSIVEACKYANQVGLTTLAFVGFQGGRLKDLAQHCLWVPSDNYGIVEDTHQSLVHVLTQFLQKCQRTPTSDPRALR
ncbi:MAG TPA: SIS domain-containing protein [Polyangiaceae bacterium]|nr:SIS domain-containing protein [Polyangiaceae bacterium]